MNIKDQIMLNKHLHHIAEDEVSHIADEVALQGENIYEWSVVEFMFYLINHGYLDCYFGLEDKSED